MKSVAFALVAAVSVIALMAIPTEIVAFATLESATAILSVVLKVTSLSASLEVTSFTASKFTSFASTAEFTFLVFTKGTSALFTTLVTFVHASLFETALVVLLVQAFLEVAVLLEALVVSRHTTFHSRSDVFAFGAQVIELAAEYLVLSQFALQRSVVERRAHRGLQADLVKALLAIGENPCVAVNELVLQL